jgi:hypothetical protein
MKVSGAEGYFTQLACIGRPVEIRAADFESIFRGVVALDIRNDIVNGLITFHSSLAAASAESGDVAPSTRDGEPRNADVEQSKLARIRRPIAGRQACIQGAVIGRRRGAPGNAF